MLRDTRRAPASGELVSVSGADPLNLVGTLLPGAKMPALHGQPHPVIATASRSPRWPAAKSSGSSRSTPADARAAEDALIKRQAGSPLLAYLR